MSDLSQAIDARAGGRAAAPSASPAGRDALVRFVVLIVAMACALAVVSLTPVRSWLHDVNKLRAAIAAGGAWAYPLCVLGVAVFVACGVPRLIFCTVGGVILGFWWGLGIVHAGTLLGYYGAFLFVRWGGRAWVLAKWPGLAKWSDGVRGQGLAAVVLARQLPLHGSVVNVLLGLSRVRHRHFLLGTTIGLLPEAIPLTLIGAGLVKGSMAGSAKYLALAAVALVVLWVGAGYAVAAMRKRDGDGAPDA